MKDDQSSITIKMRNLYIVLCVSCVFATVALLDSSVMGGNFSDWATALKMKCYTFNGEVSCSSTSIKNEHQKGNAVVKVADNDALKDAVVIGPKVKMVPWERVHNLETEIQRDNARLNLLASDKGDPLSLIQLILLLNVL